MLKSPVVVYMQIVVIFYLLSLLFQLQGSFMFSQVPSDFFLEKGRLLYLCATFVVGIIFSITAKDFIPSKTSLQILGYHFLPHLLFLIFIVSKYLAENGANLFDCGVIITKYLFPVRIIEAFCLFAFLKVGSYISCNLLADGE